MLTEEQNRFYQDNGYLLLKGLLRVHKVFVKG